MHRFKGEEREGAPAEEFPIPISPPEAINQCAVCTLQKGLASQDHPKLLTITSSTTIEKDASWLTHGNEPFQGSHVAKQLLPCLLSRSRKEKEFVSHIPKSDNPKFSQEDPLLDGVCQHLEILNHAERLEV